MDNGFDTILIGAGPCAVAALDALDRHQRVAVVTGESGEHFAPKLLHPKVRTVAVEREERPGVADMLERSFAPGKPLFATAITGGLANYWGQQVLRYEPGDPYPHTLFPDHDAYLRDCAAVERLFHISGGKVVSHDVPKGYACRQPRLMEGTMSSHGAGLRATRSAFNTLPKAATYDTPAERLQRGGAGWQVQLASGEMITAPRILLAAGVIGTARLLMASFPMIRQASFGDQTPWMLYVTGLGRLRPEGGAAHFNALTIEKISGSEKGGNGRVTLFASLYDMGRAEFNLLLASTIGHTSSMFRGWPAPPVGGLVQPVQVWTPNSFATLRLDTKGVISADTVDDTPDAALEEFRALLQRLGGKVRRATQTTPGLGYHYHALRLSHDDVEAGVAESLHALTDGAVRCVDASALPNIGLRPHSLTAMATARRLTLTAG